MSLTFRLIFDVVSLRQVRCILRQKLTETAISDPAPHSDGHWLHYWVVYPHGVRFEKIVPQAECHEGDIPVGTARLAPKCRVQREIDNSVIDCVASASDSSVKKTDTNIFGSVDPIGLLSLLRIGRLGRCPCSWAYSSYSIRGHQR